MEFDPHSFPHPSRRQLAYARNGMVAASQPLAAQAGLDILKKGGNAVDAAIAAAACLTVVEPTSNGIGGDAFALVWIRGKLHGLNSSGPAPLGISIEKLKSAGHTSMPKFGWAPVTVPGIPAAWAALAEKFGKMPLAETLKPAVQYAESGYPVSPVCAYFWDKAFKNYSKNAKRPEFANWFETFAPKGRAPRVGELWKSADHARTLRIIGASGAQSFYTGELAEKIDAFSRASGGFLRREDLAAYEPSWVEPIGINYRGYDIWEIPPNGQGLVALMALNMLKGFDFPESPDAKTCHRQLEAMKLAFADGLKYITDGKAMRQEAGDFLSERYAAERRALIGPEAGLPLPGTPPSGGTVYLAAADGEGNMVSFIQSNYMGFGSGLVVPGTGIALQNRGHDFSLDPHAQNRLEGGKRSYHTIIPGFITKDGVAVGPFGVMGGYMQPQGHVQAVMNMVDFKLNPQAALDAPRWQWIEGKTVHVESHFSADTAQKLARLGHDVQVQLESGSFGRGQIILRAEDGTLTGGTEGRTDGSIAAW